MPRERTCTGVPPGELDVRLVACLSTGRHDHLVAVVERSRGSRCHGEWRRVAPAVNLGSRCRGPVAGTYNVRSSRRPFGHLRHAGHRRVLGQAAAHRRVDGVDTAGRSRSRNLAAVDCGPWACASVRHTVKMVVPTAGSRLVTLGLRIALLIGADWGCEFQRSSVIFMAACPCIACMISARPAVGQHLGKG